MPTLQIASRYVAPRTNSLQEPILFQVEEQNISPIVFRLSLNAGTQVEQTVNIPANLVALGGYSLLVPSKKQRDTVRASHKTMGHAQERDNGFL